MKKRICVDCNESTLDYYPIPRSEEVRCSKCHEMAIVRGDRYAPGIAKRDYISQQKRKGKTVKRKKR